MVTHILFKEMIFDEKKSCWSNANFKPSRLTPTTLINHWVEWQTAVTCTNTDSNTFCVIDHSQPMSGLHHACANPHHQISGSYISGMVACAVSQPKKRYLNSFSSEEGNSWQPTSWLRIAAIHKNKPLSYPLNGPFYCFLTEISVLMQNFLTWIDPPSGRGPTSCWEGRGTCFTVKTFQTKLPYSCKSQQHKVLYCSWAGDANPKLKLS